jgi:hypothetical protein
MKGRIKDLAAICARFFVSIGTPMQLDLLALSAWDAATEANCLMDWGTLFAVLLLVALWRPGRFVSTKIECLRICFDIIIHGTTNGEQKPVNHNRPAKHL